MGGRVGGSESPGRLSRVASGRSSLRVFDFSHSLSLFSSKPALQMILMQVPPSGL
jgi:hypothetical protein